MKYTLISIVLLGIFVTTKAQNANYNSNRFIEVTGSAEMEIEPDEIRFIIGIEEYWKEEFEKNSEYKDYKTKVPISKIEYELIEDLQKTGINKEDLTIKEIGNYWRARGKEFLISKQIELVLQDFSKMDEIIKAINTKGIDYMRIGELKNKNIAQYRKEVKIEALKAAREKAGYLLESIDKEIGDVISIAEIDNENKFTWSPKSMLSNTIMNASDNSGIDNIRKIKLRYEIKARFEIK